MEEESKKALAYLMALKQSVVPADATEGAAEQRPDHSGAAGNFHERLQGTEKRRSRRYRCEGSAELREEGHNVRTWATFSDVSLHGCYLEVQATYPIGTILHMKLEANAIRLESKGRVRVNYPYLGMGIAFVEMSEENVARLKDLLGTISRSIVIMGSGSPSSLLSGGPPQAVPPILDPSAAVQALTEFFADRQMLMREDFLRIILASQGPDSLKA